MCQVHFVKYIIFFDENYVNYILSHIIDSILLLQTSLYNHSLKNGDASPFLTILCMMNCILHIQQIKTCFFDVYHTRITSPFWAKNLKSACVIFRAQRTSKMLRISSVTAFAKCPHKSIKISKEKLFIATSWLFHRGSRRFKISKKIPGRVQALSGLLFCLSKLLFAFAYITR